MVAMAMGVFGLGMDLGEGFERAGEELSRCSRL